jgi:Macrocin-O-methyltransferase (TylF)
MTGNFDERWYLSRYGDVAEAVAKGAFGSGYAHYQQFGKGEGRLAIPPPKWDYHALPPQRYMDNYQLYRRRGGLVRPEVDVLGFIKGQDGNRGDMARFYFFCLVFDQIVKWSLSGDVAEIGVWKGNTATLIVNIARQLGRTAYLLDTFEGFNSADLDGLDAKRKIEFDDTSLEAVRSFVGDACVRYVAGYFPETAVQIPEDASFCLVHVDCDLYKPIYSALEYFYPRLVPGGFLIVHDYSSLHWDGAETAVDEFFADKPETGIPLPDGGGSVVICKSK